MTRHKWEERIRIDPGICHGKPCIKGTRIMVSIIIDYLNAGESVESIIREYPQLMEEDIQSAMDYAAWLVHEEEEIPLHSEVTS